MFLLPAAGLGQEIAGESQGNKASRFNGRWTNVEPAQAAAPNALTRVDIHSNAERTFVRIWIKCGPVDCDGGEESAAIADAEQAEFGLTWRRESVGLTLRLSLLDNGLLRIEQQTRWTANPGRPAESHSVLLARSPDLKPLT